MSKEEKVNFEEVSETWGSTYMITDGPHKGYLIDLKVLATRIACTGKDGKGSPKFRISSTTASRVRRED